MADVVYFYPRGHEKHFQAGHPERPERVERIKTGLKNSQLWDRFPKLEPVQVPEDVLESVHTPGYLDTLEESSSRSRNLDMDTYTTQESWPLALQAAGGGLAVARRVWEEGAEVGFALTRPPGHHATSSRGMGFCLLNNVALAAEDLIQQQGADRIAIVDVDLHHGNGTQDIFYDRGDVFYISTHQSPFYPGTGSVSETGSGQGEKRTLNIPLPAGTGDAAFKRIQEDIFHPVLARFQPQMLLISYGFDTHWRDPLGGLQLSAARIADLIEGLHRFADVHCQGRFAVFLEGGYDLKAGAECARGIVSRLIGEPWEDRLGPSPNPEGGDWKDVVQHLQQAWSLDR